MPIVRTYITLVAGIGRMDRRHFFTWSAVGAALWVTSITLAGYFLGGVPIIRDHLEAAILLIVVLSVLPMLYEYLKHRRAGEGRRRRRGRGRRRGRRGRPRRLRLTRPLAGQWRGSSIRPEA